ncbi:NACHT domain-containing protein [Actinophytocola sp.]|uniref:NACHT domain-containing protein n=1 Tax=Actinophytocola sp. TaxID=1872138 RepID=UPI003D6A434F
MWLRYGAAVATTLLTIVSGAAALVDVVMTWRSRNREPSTDEQLAEAAQALAREVRTQWEAEAGRRLLQDAGELTVRWRTGADSGDLREIVTSYADEPRRLVVVGEPGSGKTGLCLLLTLEILRRPDPPTVPVILQVSSWDPTENLYAWLIRSITEQYPFLGDEVRYGRDAVRDLVRRQRILPVLDALDEMAEHRRAGALAAITRDARPGEPFVLTCRTAEFEGANAAGVVRDTQVVRLLPVDSEAAADYLHEAASDVGLDRWEALLVRLAADDGPVAEVLRTPLMLFLARTAYAHPDSDPGELLALPDARQVEERLLDLFPRQVFATRPPSPLSDVPRPARQWDPADAERWLAFLAKHSEREIAWWRMRNLVPLRWFVSRSIAVGAVTCTPLGWLLFALFGNPWLGVLVGFVVGVCSSAALSLVPADPPRRFVPRLLRRRELGRELAFGLIGAIVGGVAVGLLYGAGYGIAIGLVFGLAFGLVRRFTEPTEAGEAATPIGMLRSDRLAVCYAAGLGAVVGAVVGAVMGGVVGADTRGLVIDIDNPFLLGLLGGVVGAGIGAGGLGLVVQATSAWGRFITTRVWLAQRGAAPLRLMAFLEDAHRLGVLRQLGPYYQFRHALLQDRLAVRW